MKTDNFLDFLKLPYLVHDVTNVSVVFVTVVIFVTVVKVVTVDTVVTVFPVVQPVGTCGPKPCTDLSKNGNNWRLSQKYRGFKLV